MQLCPFLHECRRPPWHAAADNVSAGDFHLRLFIAICGVKVWRHVIRVIHRNPKTVETGQFGHMNAAGRSRAQKSRGDSRHPKYTRGPFDLATLAIFPEYIEFDGEEVLRLVVPGAAGRTIK